MDNATKLYWLTRLDALHIGLTILLMLSLFAMILYFTFRSIDMSGDDLKKWNRVIKFYVKPTLIISTLLLLFLPSKKEVMLIWVGGNTLDFVEENENIKELPDKSTEFIIKYLDSQIEKLDKK